MLVITDIDKAQSAACALDAHVDASSSAAAKRKVPSLACATVLRAPPAQRQKIERFNPAPKPQVAKWTVTS